jgi:hypothetical protein
MGAHRIAVDMMDKASALPTYPQRQQQKQPTDFTIGLKASTRLHDEGVKLLALLAAIGDQTCFYEQSFSRHTIGRP